MRRLAHLALKRILPSTTAKEMYDSILFQQYHENSFLIEERSLLIHKFRRGSGSVGMNLTSAKPVFFAENHDFESEEQVEPQPGHHTKYRIPIVKKYDLSMKHVSLVIAT